MAQSYLYLKKKFLKSKKFLNNLKTAIALILFLSSVVTYWYFVNVSSTKGYFIKTEREKLTEVKFKNEIVNIDIRKLESEIFNKMNMDSYNSLTWKVITVSSIPSVALR